MNTHEKECCAEYKQRIRDLNDQFRKYRVGGYFCITDGIVALGHPTYLNIIKAVAEFDDFTDDNDPHKEHDFGVINIQGQNIFWKIDYYNNNQQYASPDPSDPDVTIRYLTIMLAAEY